MVASNYMGRSLPIHMKSFVVVFAGLLRDVVLELTM